MEYRRKVQFVDAFQSGVDDIPGWFHMALVCGIAWVDDFGQIGLHDRIVLLGDYIIKGIYGEMWVCEGTYFDAYYEKNE